MKNKSTFSQIILLVVILVICVIVTLGLALLAGSYNETIFDFANLNFANMIPILIIGGFISCVAVGIAVIFMSRSVFLKVKDYFAEKTKGDEEK